MKNPSKILRIFLIAAFVMQMICAIITAKQNFHEFVKVCTDLQYTKERYEEYNKKMANSSTDAPSTATPNNAEETVVTNFSRNIEEIVVPNFNYKAYCSTGVFSGDDIITVSMDIEHCNYITLFFSQYNSVTAIRSIFMAFIPLLLSLIVKYIFKKSEEDKFQGVDEFNVL